MTMAAVVDRRRTARSTPKAETPFRRFAARVLPPSRAGAGSAWRCSRDHRCAGAARALDRAAEPLRPRQARRDGRPPARRASAASAGYHILARHRRRRAATCSSAILYGLRISLGVGVACGVVALAIGTAVGLLAAYSAAVDALIMRIVDLQLSFPAILVALILLAVLGRGVDKVMIALVSVQWAYYARTVRGAALVERRKEYIEAAQCLGLPPRRIMFRHLLPNCLPPLIVVATVQVAHAIALEATLSFLGVGLPITEPSLGLLIANGFEYMLSGKYWISFFPGIALLAHHRQHQPGRRPAARRAEPAARAMTDPRSGRGPARPISSRAPGVVKAVDGVSFAVEPRRGAGPGGRVRLGQVRDRLLDPRPGRPAGAHRRRARSCSSGDGPRRAAGGASCASCAASASR